MKIAIIGSRAFRSLHLVTLYVAQLPADTVVISGGAPGVDTDAARAAQACGLEVQIINAEWDKYAHLKQKNPAGMIRNTEIVKAADKVVAFWDLESRGTHDSLKKAKALGKAIEVYDESGVKHSF